MNDSPTTGTKDLTSGARFELESIRRGARFTAGKYRQEGAILTFVEADVLLLAELVERVCYVLGDLAGGTNTGPRPMGGGVVARGSDAAVPNGEVPVVHVPRPEGTTQPDDGAAVPAPVGSAPRRGTRARRQTAA